MTPIEAWNEYMTSKWIAGNGLGRLDPYPEDQLDGGFIDGEGLECVRNENGILFLTLFLLTSKVAGLNITPYRERFIETCELLVRKPYRGLFNRRPYGEKPIDRHEAHDNYAAIAGMGALYGAGYAQEILSYGNIHGFMYNNVSPDIYELKQQRQGGEIAFYKICAGYDPTIWEFIWWVIGILLNAFKNNAGETQLTWMRLYVTSRMYFNQKWMGFTFLFVSELWKWRKNMRFGSLKNVYREYFKPPHPIHKMAENIKDYDWGF